MVLQRMSVNTVADGPSAARPRGRGVLAGTVGGAVGGAIGGVLAAVAYFAIGFAPGPGAGTATGAGMVYRLAWIVFVAGLIGVTGGGVVGAGRGGLAGVAVRSRVRRGAAMALGAALETAMIWMVASYYALGTDMTQAELFIDAVAFGALPGAVGGLAAGGVFNRPVAGEAPRYTRGSAPLPPKAGRRRGPPTSASCPSRGGGQAGAGRRRVGASRDATNSDGPGTPRAGTGRAWLEGRLRLGADQD